MSRMVHIARLVLTSTLVVVAVGTVAPVAHAQSFERTDGAELTERQSTARVIQFERFAQRWAAELDTRAANRVGESWRTRLSKIFLAADAVNVDTALRSESLDGAITALRGLAARQPADWLASDAVAGRLGDVGADMVYTPITPCRIVDTRLTVGPVAAGAVRVFLATSTGYGSQGGNVAGCGLSAEVPGAVVLNVTAVNPAAGGFATVYASNATRPSTASLNYTAGSVVNNTVITKVPDPLFTSDFAIYSLAEAHFVVDLVGFFDTPQASPFECVNTPNEVYPLANGSAGAANPATACPANFAYVSANCTSSSPLAPLYLHTNDTCGMTNQSGATQNLIVSRRCCRVPGR